MPPISVPDMYGEWIGLREDESNPLKPQELHGVTTRVGTHQESDPKISSLCRSSPQVHPQDWCMDIMIFLISNNSLNLY